MNRLKIDIELSNDVQTLLALDSILEDIKTKRDSIFLKLSKDFKEYSKRGAENLNESEYWHFIDFLTYSDYILENNSK